MIMIQHDFSKKIEFTETALRAALEYRPMVSVYGFESLEAAKEVAASFPKYVKVKAGSCGSTTSFKEYGIENENHIERVYGDKVHHDYTAYSIGFSYDAPNGVTGEVNEAGIKRREAFIKGLIKSGLITA